MLAIKIATRYLIALRKASTVQILSGLSFAGIMLGSMAMLIVLSAFNGFETLLRQLYHFQDPDINITSASRKTFEVDSVKLAEISSISGVSSVFEIISDKAAIRYGEGQMVVELVGVPENFLQVSRLDTLLQSGNFSLRNGKEVNCLVSIGVKNALNINLKDPFGYVQILYPRQKKILQLGTTKLFNTLNAQPSGVIRLDENRLYVPILEARNLMDKPIGMNQLQIFIKEKSNISSIKEKIKTSLGPEFLVQDEYEQHGDLFRVMKIERLFVLLALGFIIIISCFNLFVSCSMLVIDKKRDIWILATMGMPESGIRKIILHTGGLITVFGLMVGLLLGWGVCWFQKEFGFVPLGMSSSMIQAYPVDVQLFDFLTVSLWVFISGFLALIYPGISAIRFSRKYQPV